MEVFVVSQKERNVMGLFGGVNNGADPWILYPKRPPVDLNLMALSLTLFSCSSVGYRIESVC